ncbi:zinc ribbon domain-containing protein, partial [Streptomyces sp. NPDC004561]
MSFALDLVRRHDFVAHEALEIRNMSKAPDPKPDPEKPGRDGRGSPQHLRRCPACGHTAKESRPTQETFRCVSCGHHAHADTVGAINVLRA